MPLPSFSTTIQTIGSEPNVILSPFIQTIGGHASSAAGQCRSVSIRPQSRVRSVRRSWHRPHSLIGFDHFERSIFGDLGLDQFGLWFAQSAAFKAIEQGFERLIG